MAKVSLISPITKQTVRKLRVAAYCRVSSNSADQLNSYANQVRVYTAMIQKKADWELVEIFADEGLSATRSDNRTEFQRMIKMCELHKIDLIIAKSMSRFARNTKESLEYCRKLKHIGVGVQFEKEGIDTRSMGDEMLMTTFAAIAQEESVATSERLRNSNTKRMMRGEFVDGNAPYGFRMKERVLVPYEPEAEIVRDIFRKYLRGVSTYEIADQLNMLGIPSKQGSKWTHTAIRYILRNEKYMGDTLFQKTYHTNVLPFKQKRNRGDEDQYYAADTHVGIISKDEYLRAKELLDYRKEKTKSQYPTEKYLLTGKMHCTCCGAFFVRKKVKGGLITWVCSNHLTDRELCPSFYYNEERIRDGFIGMVNKLRFGDEQILHQVILRLETAVNTYKKSSTAGYEMSQSIAELNAKLLMLEQLRSKGYLATEVYQAQAMDINKEIAKLKNTRLETFDTQILKMLENVRKLKSLLDEIEEPLDTFDEKLFSETVLKIEINKHDEMTVTLIGGLKFTEVI